MSQPGALPFFPHRANTPDNNPLPTDAFENTDLCGVCHQDIWAQWQSSIMSRACARCSAGVIGGGASAR